MELEELQKIWNDQNGETMYAINETALHNTITRKKKSASRRMSIIELGLMAINSTTGLVLLYGAIIDDEPFWDYSFSVIMLVTILFLLRFRWNRIKKENSFDRTLIGELDHAILNSDSMLQIATVMLKYYILPVGLFSFTKMLIVGASLEKWLLLGGAYTLAFITVYYQRKRHHIPRKEKLIRLRQKLMME